MMMNSFFSHNQLTLLHNGAEYFPLLLQEIKQAKQEIFLESYIFSDDVVGRAIAAALKAAARRGVRVHLLLDGFGSGKLPNKFIQACSQAGVRLIFFHPESGPLNLRRQRWRRMHRKIAVFDGSVAYVGGINITQDVEHQNLSPRYDYAVRVTGPLVIAIHRAVDHLWRRTCRQQLKLDWAEHSLPVLNTAAIAGQVAAAFVIRDNFRYRHAIEDNYLQAIATAKEEIIIANAYFLPSKRFCNALVAAAKRGVKVHILVQGHIDHFIQYFATQTLYERFIKAGIVIYEYMRGFMHAKVAVIDGSWATVGSSNIDPFSLLLALEANVFIRDTVFSQQLRSDVMQVLHHNAKVIQLTDLQTQPWLLRVLPSICYRLMRLIMAFLNYGKKEYE